jgi:regulator of protease activity HflC (stomatin/prohibitin superfamily)
VVAVEALLAQFKNSMPEPLWNALVLVAVLATAIWTVVRSFVIVGPGQVGIRKRFGKTMLSYAKTDALTGRTYTKEEIKYFKAFDEAEIRSFRPAKYGRPKYLYPGFNPLVPVVHSVVIIQVGINNINLGDQRIVEPENYVAYELPEISLDIRVSDAYLWMIASIDAEAQIKAIGDTHLSTILRRYATQDVLDNHSHILRDFVLSTMFALAPVGAAVELQRGGLNLGNQMLSIDAGFDAQSRREVAQAILVTGGTDIRAITDGS